MKIPNSAVGGLILLGWVGSLALAFSLYPKLVKIDKPGPTTGKEMSEAQLRAAVVALEEYQALLKENNELLDEIDELEGVAKENEFLNKFIQKNIKPGQTVIRIDNETRYYDRDCNCWVTR